MAFQCNLKLLVTCAIAIKINTTDPSNKHSSIRIVTLQYFVPGMNANLLRFISQKSKIESKDAKAKPNKRYSLTTCSATLMFSLLL